MSFPDVELANPQGMLAVGGDYDWRRLVSAYAKGIFPWSGPGEPIVWWSPDPRYVIFPDKLRVKRSMRPYINNRRFKVTYDTHFAEVIEACKHSPRQGEEVGSWITEDLMDGYIRLHEEGFAHSVEVWSEQGELVGGLYGVGLGKVFCGESMFSRVSNASKYALIHLVKNLRRRGYVLIDCQMATEHLISLGARPMARKDFSKTLSQNDLDATDRGSWSNLFTDDALDDKLPSK